LLGAGKTLEKIERSTKVVPPEDFCAVALANLMLETIASFFDSRAPTRVTRRGFLPFGFVFTLKNFRDPCAGCARLHQGHSVWADWWQALK
jgi:hypothetical protein